MIYKYNKLKSKITEHYGYQNAFAEAIGRNNGYVSQVLNSKTFLTQNEIEKWAEALQIDRSEYGLYFFSHYVDEAQTEEEKNEA